VVIPSAHEGFPVVALEALWSKCRVVASAVGGLRELHEECPWSVELVRPDDPRALAAGILRLQERDTRNDLPATLRWRVFSANVARGLASTQVADFRP
jgi:glycosyltransferase involved in cell wall biosynthesis